MIKVFSTEFTNQELYVSWSDVKFFELATKAGERIATGKTMRDLAGFAFKHGALGVFYRF